MCSFLTQTVQLFVRLESYFSAILSHFVSFTPSEQRTVEQMNSFFKSMCNACKKKTTNGTVKAMK